MGPEDKSPSAADFRFHGFSQILQSLLLVCMFGGEGVYKNFVYTSCAKDKEKGYQIVMPSF